MKRLKGKIKLIRVPHGKGIAPLGIRNAMRGWVMPFMGFEPLYKTVVTSGSLNFIYVKIRGPYYIVPMDAVLTAAAEHSSWQRKFWERFQRQNPKIQVLALRPRDCRRA